MKKSLLAILIAFLFMYTVKAADPVLVASCPEGGTIESTLKCTLKIKAEVNINEVSLDYDFNGNLEFVSYTPASNFEAISNTATGFKIKNATGITGEFSIGSVSFKLSKVGNFTLKNIKITDIEGVTYTASILEQPIGVLSEDNTLKSLSISPGVLKPEFQSNVYTYEAEVDSANITINATANDDKAKLEKTIKQSLNYGKNTINFVVTSESGSKRTYKLIITRKDNRSVNNNLKELKLSIGTIDFNPNNNLYTIKVNSSVEEVDIIAELADDKASFVSNYGPRKINLINEKTIADIKVKSESDSIKTYTLTFVKSDRELSSNNNIKELTLEGHEINFNTNTHLYNIKLKKDESLNFKVVLEDENATYKLENADLKNGNIVVIKVIAENGDVKEYKFYITKEEIKEKNAFFDDFLCNDNSIIYYLIVFVLGLIIATLITSIIYLRKIKKLKANYEKKLQNNEHPVSENTEILFFNDPNQNGYNK